jgi:CBS domain containing-hemolysin-like protein
MIWLNLVLILFLLAVLTLGSYVSGVYFERGKLLSREFQENIDAWEELAEPRLGMRRERIALSAEVLTELSFGILALVFGVLLFAGARRPGFGEVAQAVLALVLVVIIFHRLLPYVFFVRTRGRWVAGWVLVYRVLFLLVLPVTIALGFLFSVASLAEPAPAEELDKPTEDDEALDALIEAGEEEGILEESDRELVRSVVEFGDKIVREVMTPRPRIFALPVKMNVAEFKAALKAKPYSRVPVYRGTLDNISGIAFAHDVLQIPDTDAPKTPLASIEHPASFVPETKRVSELLREMQRKKQHMQIVIDEYGSVAGLVTIEDLLEEIVGAISDEHEHEPDDSPQPDGSGGFVVPGSFEVSRIENLWGADNEVELPETNATTVGGLVVELSGRIPLPGEVVPAGDLRLEVLASTGRRVERVRVGLNGKVHVTGAGEDDDPPE